MADDSANVPSLEFHANELAVNETKLEILYNAAASVEPSSNEIGLELLSTVAVAQSSEADSGENDLPNEICRLLKEKKSWAALAEENRKLQMRNSRLETELLNERGHRKKQRSDRINYLA